MKRSALYEAPDSENEALFIADTIENRLARNPKERVAILYRTNAQSRQIEEALRRYGRKYVVVGGFSFYQRAEVKDAIAYLKVAGQPHDSVSLLRIINTPARGIGKTTVEQIEQYAQTHGLPLWNALEEMLDQRLFPGRAEAALAAFHRMMKELRENVDERPAFDTLAAVLSETGYKKSLEEEAHRRGSRPARQSGRASECAVDAAERGESMRDFLDHAALVSDADSADERATISLLTMHNAKGLEFPVVFIAGLEEGLFPHSRSLDSEAAMEEERRLCYVGMTRAETKLFLSWARLPTALRRRSARTIHPFAIPQRGPAGPAGSRAWRPGPRGSYTPSATRSATRRAETFILGRLIIRWRTSSSSSPKRACRRLRDWEHRSRQRQCRRSR